MCHVLDIASLVVRPNWAFSVISWVECATWHRRVWRWPIDKRSTSDPDSFCQNCYERYDKFVNVKIFTSYSKIIFKTKQTGYSKCSMSDFSAADFSEFSLHRSSAAVRLILPVMDSGHLPRAEIQKPLWNNWSSFMTELTETDEKTVMEIGASRSVGYWSWLTMPMQHKDYATCERLGTNCTRIF